MVPLHASDESTIALGCYVYDGGSQIPVRVRLQLELLYRTWRNNLWDLNKVHGQVADMTEPSHYVRAFLILNNQTVHDLGSHILFEILSVSYIAT